LDRDRSGGDWPGIALVAMGAILLLASSFA
jgi:hypothetical protein